MRTETGRFAVNAKICFSMSDFHPELWSPMWSIKSIIMGLISFFNSEEITTGGVRATKQQRVKAAKLSLDTLKNKDKLAMDIFGDVIDKMIEERGDLQGKWPPVRFKEEGGDGETNDKQGCDEEEEEEDEEEESEEKEKTNEVEKEKTNGVETEKVRRRSKLFAANKRKAQHTH